MSENDKDNKDFEFIKEQVIEKKRKKVKKWLIPPAMTLCMAILFGTVAAFTIAVAEPRFHKLLNKEEEVKTPVVFPTASPANPDSGNEAVNTNTTEVTPTADVTETPEPTPVIVEKSIAANIGDYISINNEIRKVAADVDRSLVNITSLFTVKDWFGKSVENTVNTTGVIIYNNSKELLILVSLDRVNGANSIKVNLSDILSVDAAVQDYDSEINLAIIAIEIADIPEGYMNRLQVADFGESYSVTVGNPIIALGSPNGHPDSMELGMVTSQGGYAYITDNKIDLFNTSIQDNKYSDGIIVNLDGKIIGVITHTLKDDLNEDLNTVIGISRIIPIIQAMGNKTPRVYFGVNADDMTDATKKEHNITNGIYVNEVQADSPAFKAGMQNGDIILELNEQPVLNMNSFNSLITSGKPGAEMKVRIKRTTGSTEEEMILKVVLADKTK